MPSISQFPIHITYDEYVDYLKQNPGMEIMPQGDSMRNPLWRIMCDRVANAPGYMRVVISPKGICRLCGPEEVFVTVCSKLTNVITNIRSRMLSGDLITTEAVLAMLPPDEKPPTVSYQRFVDWLIDQYKGAHADREFTKPATATAMYGIAHQIQLTLPTYVYCTNNGIYATEDNRHLMALDEPLTQFMEYIEQLGAGPTLSKWTVKRMHEVWEDHVRIKRGEEPVNPLNKLPNHKVATSTTTPPQSMPSDPMNKPIHLTWSHFIEYIRSRNVTHPVVITPEHNSLLMDFIGMRCGTSAVTDIRNGMAVRRLSSEPDIEVATIEQRILEFMQWLSTYNHLAERLPFENYQSKQLTVGDVCGAIFRRRNAAGIGEPFGNKAATLVPTIYFDDLEAVLREAPEDGKFLINQDVNELATAALRKDISSLPAWTYTDGKSMWITEKHPTEEGTREVRVAYFSNYTAGIHKCMCNQHPWAPGEARTAFAQYNDHQVVKIAPKPKPKVFLAGPIINKSIEAQPMFPHPGKGMTEMVDTILATKPEDARTEPAPLSKKLPTTKQSTDQQNTHQPTEINAMNQNPKSTDTDTKSTKLSILRRLKPIMLPAAALALVYGGTGVPQSDGTVKPRYQTINWQQVGNDTGKWMYDNKLAVAGGILLLGLSRLASKTGKDKTIAFITHPSTAITAAGLMISGATIATPHTDMTVERAATISQLTNEVASLHKTNAEQAATIAKLTPAVPVTTTTNVAAPAPQ